MSYLRFLSICIPRLEKVKDSIINGQPLNNIFYAKTSWIKQWCTVSNKVCWKISSKPKWLYSTKHQKGHSSPEQYDRRTNTLDRQSMKIPIQIKMLSLVEQARSTFASMKTFFINRNVSIQIRTRMVQSYIFPALIWFQKPSRCICTGQSSNILD